MKALEITFILDTAACLSSTPAQGNEMKTLRYIPGGVVRGMLAEAYLRNYEQADERFNKLFSETGLRFGNLIPVADGGQSNILPLSAYTCKRAGGFKNDTLPFSKYAHTDDTFAHGVFNLLFETLSKQERKCPDCAHALAPLQADFYKKSGDSFHTANLKVATHMRTSVGHGGSAREGFLFSQEEITAGTQFRGKMFGDAQQIYDLTKVLDLKTASTLTAFTGRRRSGKGRLEIREASESKNAKNLLHSWENTPGVWGTLTITSDTILVDHLLRPITRVDEGVLYDYCGLPAGEEVRVEKALIACRRIAGWSGVGQMFRPDDVALVAGSSFLLNFPNGATQALRDWGNHLESNGLGLRRVEGFGQVTFHDPLHLASFSNQHGSKAQ